MPAPSATSEISYSRSLQVESVISSPAVLPEHGPVRTISGDLEGGIDVGLIVGVEPALEPERGLLDVRQIQSFGSQVVGSALACGIIPVQVHTVDVAAGGAGRRVGVAVGATLPGGSAKRPLPLRRPARTAVEREVINNGRATHLKVHVARRVSVVIGRVDEGHGVAVVAVAQRVGSGVDAHGNRSVAQRGQSATCRAQGHPGLSFANGVADRGFVEILKGVVDAVWRERTAYWSRRIEIACGGHMQSGRGLGRSDHPERGGRQRESRY